MRLDQGLSVLAEEDPGPESDGAGSEPHSALANCLISGKPCDLSGPEFPHLHPGGGSAHLEELSYVERVCIPGVPSTRLSGSKSSAVVIVFPSLLLEEGFSRAALLMF